MKELIAGFAADGPLPEPFVYTVREVIHGSGRLAHSHYYRENPNEEAPNFDHSDHADMESNEKLHEVSVAPLEELRDLAFGIPKIAAKGNIDETSWETVNKISKEMTELLGRHNDKTTLQEKRQQIKSHSKQFEAWIATIDQSLNSGPKDESKEGQ